jgi:chromatin segregation and condensation protein Rec8/ScpA/Scc1 (kleisin family)
MILATAFFVKVKSDKLMDEDIEALDTMMMEPGELYDELEEPEEPAPFQDAEPELVPHTPQPRKRKVSVQDLASALESALEQEQRNYMKRVKNRREQEAEAPEVDAPEEQRSIEAIIDDVYTTIKSYFKKVREVTFDNLVSEETREEKVQTFIPLLHLDNQGKVILHQDEAFDDIKVVKDDQQA